MAENSGGQKSLKSQNLPKLWAFMAANIFMAWSIVMLGDVDFQRLRDVDLTQVIGLWLQSVAEKGALLGLGTFLAVVANGILSSRVKEILVFWRLRDPLPGARAFTELVQCDPRIDLQELTRMLGKLPVAPHEQNATWYKIYKKHESKVSVQDAQRSYLLTRDMTGFTVLTFCMVLIVGLLLTLPMKRLFICLVIPLLEYLVSAIAARNYGNRFVCDVLAEETAKLKKPRARSSKQIAS
jgi:hypothetical protein